MWKFIAAILAVIVVVVFGFSLIDNSSGDDVSATVDLGIPQADISGYERAVEIREWDFPRDHGAHETFQTEWWYYTGNLETETGRRFGYQFTIFRRAIVPTVEQTVSEWRTNQVYMAHFTLSDIEANQFHEDERLSRGSADLAGALPNDRQPDENYRVWIEDWTAYATNPDATEFRITAVSEQGFKVDLTLKQAKPVAFQGDRGLSAKSGVEGNASYYYSLTRLETSGVVTTNGESFDVNGTTWMDHEFSTSALGVNALGWDWFGLQSDNGIEIMVGQIRLLGGGIEPAFHGLVMYPDGSTEFLESSEFAITATGEWTSPHSGATYPSGWTIEIRGDNPITFDVTPLMLDQELHGGSTIYWEGAVRLSGDITGYGYAELTGYANIIGRF